MNEYQDQSPRSEADAVAEIVRAATMVPQTMVVEGREVLLLPDLNLTLKESWKVFVGKLRTALPEPWQGRVFDAA